MTKYIVKNCPACIINGQCAMNGEHDSPFEPVPCKDRTDCPIKQIVEKCLPQSHIPEVDDLKEQILQTLQVQEVE